MASRRRSERKRRERGGRTSWRHRRSSGRFAPGSAAWCECVPWPGSNRRRILNSSKFVSGHPHHRVGTKIIDWPAALLRSKLPVRQSSVTVSVESLKGRAGRFAGAGDGWCRHSQSQSGTRKQGHWDTPGGSSRSMTARDGGQLFIDQDPDDSAGGPPLTLTALHESGLGLIR